MNINICIIIKIMNYEILLSGAQPVERGIQTAHSRSSADTRMYY